MPVQTSESAFVARFFGQHRSRRLDRVEKMAIGAGALDFGAYLRGNQDSLRTGLQLDYAHRMRRSISLFGQGWGGLRHEFGLGTELDYGALAGLRMRW